MRRKKKLAIRELAEELGVHSSAIINACDELNIWFAKSPLTTIPKHQADRIREHLSPSETERPQSWINSFATKVRSTFCFILDRLRGLTITLVLITLLTVVPAQIAGVLAILFVFIILVAFVWRVIRESWSELSSISYWQLILAICRTPFYCVPGFFLFGFAAVLLYAFDGLVIGAIETAIPSIFDGAQARVEELQKYQDNKPSFWNFREHVTWLFVKHTVPLKGVDAIFSWQGAITNFVVSTLNYIGIGTWACLAFGVVRFVMQVGSRLALGKSLQVTFSVESVSASSSKESNGPVPCSSGLTLCEIDLQHDQSFFATSRANGSGPMPHGSNPQPFRCLIPRLRWNLWRLRRFEYEAIPISFPSSHGKQYIKICLRDSERLCVDCEHLMGFSNGVRFSMKWTFKLSALLVNRMAFTVLTGPGTVLLRTNGESEIIDARSEPPKKKTWAPGQLVAWSIGSVFGVASSTNFLDIYGEPAYLNVKATDIVVFDPEHDQAKQNLIATPFRWLGRAIWPF